MAKPTPNRKPRKIVPTLSIADATPITMEPVQSTLLHSIGHDAESSTLAIRFRGYEGAPGNLYHYANFTADQYATFAAAPSHGGFFTTEIKPHAALFPFTKIIEDAPAT